MLAIRTFEVRYDTPQDGVVQENERLSQVTVSLAPQIRSNVSRRLFCDLKLRDKGVSPSASRTSPAAKSNIAASNCLFIVATINGVAFQDLYLHQRLLPSE